MYILPKYSPIIPKLHKINPPIMDTAAIVELHPVGTAGFRILLISMKMT